MARVWTDGVRGAGSSGLGEVIVLHTESQVAFKVSLEGWGSAPTEIALKGILEQFINVLEGTEDFQLMGVANIYQNSRYAEEEPAPE